MAMVCLLVQPAISSGSLTERIPVEPGQTLTVNLRTGASLNVKTWNEPAVEARMEVIECSGGDVEISLMASRNGAEIRSDFRSRRNGHMVRTNIVIDVMVPESFNLEVTSSGGTVQVDGLKGRLSGSTAGGSITISSMEGSVRFSSGGGGVSLLDSRLDANIRSGGGAIRVENSVIAGGINTGGGNISVKNSTLNGGTNTGGGSITADGIRGRYYAATGAGNIQVTVAEGSGMDEMNLRLGTGSGNVTVMVPKAMRPDISVELAYTQNHRNASDIMSDFDLDMAFTDEWDDSKGTPKKYVYGTSPEGNPGQQIRIRNTNGNVVLKKY